MSETIKTAKLEKLKVNDVCSTLLSAVDTLAEAQYKIEIARTLYSSIAFQYFDNNLEATPNNEAAFFNQRDNIRNEIAALMEFVMQAYADVTKTLASIEAKCDELKENER